ncbi:MAG: carbon-nitrogen hydrolase family protein [Granulosicoccus sp.]
MKLCIMQARPVSGDNSLFDNLQSIDKAAAQAAAAQADILVTPEMFLTGYNIGATAVRAAAQHTDGSMLQQVASLARKYKVAIVVGFPELATDARVYNSVAFIGSCGNTLCVYRKTHLFGDVDRAQFTAGAILTTPVSYQGWQIALAICYDIEFPEVARFYAQSGADVILTPTANMAPFFSVASNMVPVRAQENAVYIAYANYIGSEGEFSYCGLSCICGPSGDDIARAASSGEELIFGSLSRQHLQDVRTSTPYLQDIRPELYTS